MHRGAFAGGASFAREQVSPKMTLVNGQAGQDPTEVSQSPPETRGSVLWLRARRFAEGCSHCFEFISSEAAAIR